MTKLTFQHPIYVFYHVVCYRVKHRDLNLKLNTGIIIINNNNDNNSNHINNNNNNNNSSSSSSSSRSNNTNNNSALQLTLTLNLNLSQAAYAIQALCQTCWVRLSRLTLPRAANQRWGVGGSARTVDGPASGSFKSFQVKVVI